MEDIFFLISIWFTTLLIGLVSWPIVAFVLQPLSDKGYIISKIFGWLAISYFLFLFATLQLLPLTLGSIIGIVIAWTALNAFIEWKWRTIRRSRIDWRQLAATEFAFFALMGIWAFIRGHNPEILTIERFMDYGFMQVLANSMYLPAESIWFSGESINYYYFGHIIGYVALLFSGIPFLPGFFVLVAWMFGLLGIASYRLGVDIGALLLEKTNFYKPPYLIAAGLISFFTVMLAGTWHTIWWAIQALWAWMQGNEIPFFWYPESTRIMTGAITEMPVYSFIVADLHAHVWGLFNGIIVLALLYALWKSVLPLAWNNPYLWALSFMLGISYMTNSWDAATLGTLSVLILIAKYASQASWKVFAYGIGLAAASYAFALPWSLFYEPPVSGIGLVPERSTILAWLSFWGGFAFIIALFGIGSFLLWHRRKRIKRKYLDSFPSAPGFPIPIIAFSVLLFIAMEIIYVRDILHAGEWFRANTVFKLTMQIWLWLGVLTGPIILWTLWILRSDWKQPALALLIFLMLVGQAVYPIQAVRQTQLEGREYLGLGEGLHWWQDQYPYDYEAYLFLQELREELPREDRLRRIVEGDGDSYTASSRFSVFLGWPTIIGWPVHEWTWRGSYDPIGERRDDVRQLYIGISEEETQEIIDRYGIDFIIAGEFERGLYGDIIQYEKLRALGEVIFENEGTIVIEIQ